MQKRPMQSVEQPGSMQGLIIGTPPQCPSDTTLKPPSEVREPPRRFARAVFVLRVAAAAHPVLPPDPLQVIDLEHDQAEDREEELRPVQGTPVFRKPGLFA